MPRAQLGRTARKHEDQPPTGMQTFFPPLKFRRPFISVMGVRSTPIGLGKRSRSMFTVDIAYKWKARKMFCVALL